MTIHRANCADCAWSYEGDDQEAVADALERHSRKEQHHVEFERAVATDGGLDYDVVEAIRGFLREDLDRGQWKVYYAKRIAKNVPYSSHKVGYYLGRICGLDPRVDAIDIDDSELEIEPWDSAASRRRWRVERSAPADGEEGGPKPLVADGGVPTERVRVTGARGIVYGPAADAEGYVLQVATEERRVEIELDKDAMYTLWTEVKGVPWPEPDHIGEKDRLVRQVLHAANGADEEMLKDALAVLGGER